MLLILRSSQQNSSLEEEYLHPSSADLISLEVVEKEYFEIPDRNYRSHLSQASSTWDYLSSEVGVDIISDYDITLLEQTEPLLQQVEDPDTHLDDCLCRYCRFFMAYQEWELDQGANVPVGSETGEMLSELHNTILARMRTFTPENVQAENDVSTLKFYMMNVDEKAEFVNRSMMRLRRLSDFQTIELGSCIGDDGDETEELPPLEVLCLGETFWYH